MNIYKYTKSVAYATIFLLFIWFFVLKIVARIAAQLGKSAPCPASLAWLVNNPLRRRYMHPVLDWVGIQPGEQVLELGPGPGAFTIAAARQAGPDGRLIGGGYPATDDRPGTTTSARVRFNKRRNTRCQRVRSTHP